MAQFDDNTNMYYFGQPFQNFNESSMPEFNLAQQQYAHRASDPLGSLQHTQLARVGRDLPLQRLTKPEDHSPWSSQIRYTQQQQHQQFSPTLWQGNVHGRGAKTEPVPNQEIYFERRASQKDSEVSDSAYASMPASSLPQDNYNSNRQELEQNFQSSYFPSFKAEQGGETFPDSITPNPPLSVKSEGHHLSTHHRDNRKRQPVRPCGVCGRQPKNLSDGKKHALTHTKPHRCTEPNCERKDGFATDNDLQRHRKSVHNLLPTVGSAAGYICAACPAPEGGGKSKFWPRRDNFKAHIKRKHADYNEVQLIEASKQIMRPDDARTVEDDDRSVRSAMRSSRHSQGDHSEMQGYDTSPNLARNVPDHSNFSNNIFPDSAIDMHQDSFAGMGGHAVETNMSFSQYGMASTDANSTNSLDMLTSSHATYGESVLSTSPFKKPKLDHENYSYGHQAAPTFQMTVSEHTTTTSTSNAQSTTTSAPSQGDFPCPNCSKTKRRECDLKKHMKRHTRPYGCTFPACHKKFGSRNDWKRHESSQHFLHEMWKCSRPRPDGKQCTRRPFRDIEALKKHLRGEDHRFEGTEAELLDECRKYLLGREGHERFWCGFCQCLVRQEKALQNAWDARFKHIGDHFDKESKEIGEWVCIEENKKKKFITPPAVEEGVGKRRGSKREVEEEGELPSYDPGILGGGSGFGSYDGGFGNGFLEADAGGKRKQGGFDVDAEGETDYEMN